MGNNKLKTLTLGLSAVVLAGSLSLATSSAQAKTVVKPTSTGIGYAHTRFRAKRLAIRAWERGVRRKFGRRYANYYKAYSRSVSCDYIGRYRYKNPGLRSYGRRRGAIDQIGSPNAPWTCSALGRPTIKTYHPPRPIPGYKPVATGVGYAYSSAGARGLAIRAWTRAVSRAYGPAYASYSRATQKDIRCDYIGRSRPYGYSYRKRRGVIGQAGNVNASWTCTATGRPRYY